MFKIFCVTRNSKKTMTEKSESTVELKEKEDDCDSMPDLEDSNSSETLNPRAAPEPVNIEFVRDDTKCVDVLVSVQEIMEQKLDIDSLPIITWPLPTSEDVIVQTTVIKRNGKYYREIMTEKNVQDSRKWNTLIDEYEKVLKKQMALYHQAMTADSTSLNVQQSTAFVSRDKIQEVPHR